MTEVKNETPATPETPATDETATASPEAVSHRDGDKLDDGTTFVRVATDGTFVTSESLAESARTADGSKVDVARFEAAFSQFREKLAALGNAWRTVNNLTEACAALMMETRLSVILKNGDPDYWGKTRAYRSLFDDRVKGWMRDQGFGYDETDKILTNVRTNYFRTHQTVLEAVAREEVIRGKVDGQRGVKSAAVQTITDDDGNESEAIVITYDKTDRKTGENVVETYVPGADEMPTPLRNAIKNAAARADEGTPGRKVSDSLPARVTGKASTGSGQRGNEKGTNQRNYATETSAAFRKLNEAVGHVAPLEMIEQLHEYLTTLSDSLIGAPGVKGPQSLTGGPAAIGEALYGPAMLLQKTAAVLSSKGNKTDVAKFRLSDEEETDDDDDENENESETAAASAAATN